MAGRRVDAVTFDYWNTLFYEERGHLRGRRLGAWLGILEDAGFAVERQVIERAFDQSWDSYVASWTANRQYDAARAAEEIIEALGYDGPTRVRVDLLAAYRDAGSEAELHLAPHLGACLRALHEAGVKIGIVCDVGMTPSPVLRRHLELDLGVPQGREAGFLHPAIVVTAQRILDAHPSVVHVVPLTSTIRHFHSEMLIEPDPANGLARLSAAQCQHLRAVSPSRISAVRGNVGATVLAQIRETVAVLVDLPGSPL